MIGFAGDAILLLSQYRGAEYAETSLCKVDDIA